MAPGGEILRSDDDGKTWKRVVAGFRNEYDFAFNTEGELFTFDSDMEWDVGLPWYRPVRVNHCPIGAEFGWRNGSGKWPTYFFDSLPGVHDVGRGSPTGVTFYQGNQFPAKYHDSFLVCDWSQGRILAVFLKRAGASYSADEHRAGHAASRSTAPTSRSARRDPSISRPAAAGPRGACSGSAGAENRSADAEQPIRTRPDSTPRAEPGTGDTQID